MSIYVCSDLHGCAKEFFLLLKVIKFSSEDTLYILGDIFDRGPDPLAIYDFIKDKENIIFIRGNHEQFFIDCCESVTEDNIKKICTIWVQNGGEITLKSILAKEKEYYDELYRYLKESPYIKKVGDYILVHAGLKLREGYEDMTLEEIINYQSEHDILWDTEFIKGDRYIEGVTVIVGHTPTELIAPGECNILHKKGKILIDCGLVFGGKLGCLRLDDMEEFYI